MSVRHIDYDGLLEIHSEIANQPRDRIGILNEGNLHYCIDSVIERGKHSVLIENCVDKAAFYIWCISVCHGFSDFNKRTAYQVASVFLLANGFQIHVLETEIPDVVLMMRQISLEQTTIGNVKEWISKHIKPVSL